MDSSFSPAAKEEKEVVSIVDPFLKEALQNPRHRLTILRMELDIQSFMQNRDQQLLEFPHFPTSYLRLAAHRVAQHYGLQSMVADNAMDGLRTRIVVKKTPETKYPSLRLSEIPAEQLENDKPERVKIAIKQRSQSTSLDGSNGAGGKHSRLKTMEERREEYERARARIFNSSTTDPPEDVVVSYNTADEDELEKSGVSRVAIFRDREKDRSDPDYDRSYERYVRGLPPQSFISLGGGPYNMAAFGYPQQQHAAVNYRPSFCAVGLNQTSLYMQCPGLAMMHSYEQVRHAAVFQAPFYHQQPLSFDYSQNY